MAALPANIIEAIEADDWWGRWFQRGDWRAWKAFLRAVFGLPQPPDGLEIYRECTRREVSPERRAREVWAVVGRRGGKSRVMATLAAYLAIFVDWSANLAPGEVGTVQLIARDRGQARVVFRFLRSLIVDHTRLGGLVVSETQQSLELSNRIVIEITTASFRSARGYTLCAGLCDELAFWLDDAAAANPAGEVIAAMRPGLLTMPGSLLLCCSSPYRRSGPLWDAYRQHFGRDHDPILVWSAPTTTMHPDVDRAEIDRMYAEDPVRAAAEFGAQFRSDLESFINREVVEALVVPGRYELGRLAGEHYVGFVDAAGGSGRESMAWAIAHRDRKTAMLVLDLVREQRSPFVPDDTVAECAADLRRYGLYRASGDRYAGDWPADAFRRHGVTYTPAEQTKSQIYHELLPALNSHRVELLDNPRLIEQLCGLERRVARGGRDSIDHPQPYGFDDLINAASGALLAVSGDALSIWHTLAKQERELQEARALPRQEYYPAPGCLGGRVLQ